MTKVQNLHAEVNCIGCDTSYNVLRSTFSSICLKDNSVIILIHPQFFLNIYNGRVAASCQVCTYLSPGSDTTVINIEKELSM